MIHVECRGYDEMGAKLCSIVNEAVAGMSKRARVVNVNVVSEPRRCEHETPCTLVYFVLETLEGTS